ncbi:PREDICTED: big defensin-like [Branchiostoma belcheri]|uniref:Big defensin-like n=1 Tax=Branchiostoma belcheri TaxID=7741 RepID=A0A6P4YY11_BRABE|nr:PREDICTED: big defensin-like [Branchiostoma belcheri]
MEKKTAYCLLLLVLLVPYTTLGAVVKRAPPKKGTEARQLAIPAVYFGAAVAPAVWQFLVAAYGAAAVAAAGVTISNHNSHSCGGLGIEGHCRAECQANEFVDDYYSVVCHQGAGYKCCRPEEM